jgi:hypothetical protein
VESTFILEYCEEGIREHCEMVAFRIRGKANGLEQITYFNLTSFE